MQRLILVFGVFTSSTLVADPVGLARADDSVSEVFSKDFASMRPPVRGRPASQVVLHYHSFQG